MSPPPPPPLPGSARRSVTLRDVAQAAGVSLITASRALSNPSRVSADTIARVQAAVVATGYVPNLLAGGLKSRRSRTIAALVPVISVPQFLPTVQTLTEVFDQHGYQLLLGQSGYDRARETVLLHTMLGRQVDGIVSAGLLAPGPATGRLREHGLPVVETWDFSDHPVDMLVGFSHRAVGAAVARFFQARGWSRVGVASADDERARQRVEGFREAYGHAVPTALVAAPSTLAAGREALGRLLARAPSLRAVTCSSDALADGVCTEARSRGLRVPQDLAVCGFGDAAFAAHLEPSLTSVRIDGARIGRLAAEMIVARCDGLPVAPARVDVGFDIVERGTTAVT